jgi:OOP family OmpA-OmpF porin
MKHFLIFAAFTANAVQAQPDAVVAAGTPVFNSFGSPWTTVAASQPAPLTAEVRFDFDASELREADRKALDELVERIHAREVRNVVATAHADRLGGELYNLGLSARRAHAVRDYLVERGIPESVIHVDVAGAATPLSACDGLGDESRRNLKLVACLQPDRRVEVEAAAK